MQDGVSDGDVARAAAARIETGIDSLVDEMFAVLARDLALAELLTSELLCVAREIARRDLLHEINAITEGWVLPERSPIEVIETAHRTAELDAPVTVPLQCYRAGHRALWAAWRAEIEVLGLPISQAQSLLDQGSSFFFDYADRCSALVVEHYTRHRDEINRARGHRHFLAVCQVLDGTTDVLDDESHDLSRHHVAAILTGDHDGATLATLTAHFRAAPLTVSLDDGTAWAWFSTVREPHPLHNNLLAALPGSASVGLGEAGHGVDGFRRTHRQARQALEIAKRRGAAGLRYRDAALEAVASGSLERAQDFLTHELQGLDTPPPARAPLRDTLRVYLACGQNAAQAARQLKVHERTIAYRLKLIEERLHTTIAARHAELALALRLETLAVTRQASVATRPARTGERRGQPWRGRRSL